MKRILIGIAGGSGCGKSTLSYGLKDKYPDLVEVIHFDDYQKEENNVPLFENMRNWDHPNAIDFKQLYKDLLQLKNGNEVSILTKSGVINPTYEEKGRISHIMKPKEIILVEGYLSLQNEKIRELFDYKIFLDIPITESMKRRDKVTYNDEDEYNNKILIPMHKKFVEPTKNYANLKIDVLKNNKDKVYKIVHNELVKLNILACT